MNQIENELQRLQLVELELELDLQQEQQLHQSKDWKNNYLINK